MLASKELIEIYVALREATAQMADAARSSDWERFALQESQSVQLLSSIEKSFNLESLTTEARSCIASEIREILKLQDEINKLADDWRKNQTRQYQSDAMSVKLSNAYS